MAKSKASSELRQQLVKTFENPNYRPPPLPSVATEIVALGNREDVDIEDVVRLLERDEMLAGAVVRLVNSRMYVGRGPIRSLREAVIRVGVRKVQDVVFEAALRGGVFSLPGYEETMERIRLHSTVTAYRGDRRQPDRALLGSHRGTAGSRRKLDACGHGRPAPGQRRPIRPRTR